jgi:hypothetical protein
MTRDEFIRRWEDTFVGEVLLALFSERVAGGEASLKAKQAIMKARERLGDAYDSIIKPAPKK